MARTEQPDEVPEIDTARFLSTVYAELRAVARQRCAKLPPGQTISPTSLVHEVWLRMEAQGCDAWASRAQFFAAAGNLMRNILVDRAREKSALKNGGARRRIDLPTEEQPAPQRFEDLDAVNEALERLEQEDPRAARLVTLRFFAGMTVEEAAVALEISPRTARRDWSFAKAWLFRELAPVDDEI